MNENDAPFIYELLNTYEWLNNIGDKGVHSLEDARNYLVTGPMSMYKDLGFGLYLVEIKSENVPIGICGLIKRDSLDDIDIGFAFLPEYSGLGYAYEASQAVVHYAKSQMKLERLVAITTADNPRSIKLLNKLGLNYEKDVPGSSNASALGLYSIEF